MKSLNSVALDGRTHTRTLVSHQDAALNAIISEAARTCAITNVFNPSIVAVGDDILVAVRGEAFAGERPFRSWFIHARASGQIVTIIDLTETAREAGVTIVADPKLVRLGDEVYATFNTGYTLTGPNTIFLQRVFPTIGHPQECRLSTRQRIEKNWAFLVDPQGNLAAVYGVAPIQTLVLRSGTLGGAGTLDFALQSSEGRSDLSDRYSIGTQIHASADGEMQLVVHQKHRIMHKRAYTGRLARLSWEGAPAVQLSSTRLIHSYAAALPQLRPHNRRLISATYFSGISGRDGHLLMSYGINDKAFGIARVRESDVWTTEGAKP